MSVKKKCQVVMLPTLNKAQITQDTSLLGMPLRFKNVPIDKWPNTLNYHLYITIFEFVKKGDYIIYNNQLLKVIDDHVVKMQKVVITTDKSLIIKGECKIRSGKNIELYPTEYKLPQPSDFFIEKYVEEYNKGNIITHILVEYILEHDLRTQDKTKEFNEILKVNPRDNTVTVQKVKNNWNRVELIDLLSKYHIWKISHPHTSIDVFIEENL